MVSNRLGEYIEYKGVSFYAFENALGASRGSISKAVKGNKSIGSEVLENILNHYQDINPEWLLTGRGKMLKEGKTPPDSEAEPNVSIVSEPSPQYQVREKIITVTVNEQGNENALFVPVKARAGYLMGYGDAKYLTKLPAYRLPKMDNKSYRLFEVDGYSMYDTLAPGDIVITSRVDSLDDVRDSRVYVFLCNGAHTNGEGGIVVKRALNRLKKYGVMILKSDNIRNAGEYPDINLHDEDIYEVWYVEGFISNKLRDPRDIFDRLNNLEADVAFLRGQINP